LSGIEAVGDAPRLEVRLTIDGASHQFASISVVVANMAPLFSILAHGGGPPRSRDGKLDITWMLYEDGVAARALSLLELIRAGLSDSRPGDGIGHARGREILLETDPPTLVTVDGEACLQTPVRIQVIPQALHVIFGEGVPAS
jgi:diacylglycerol kinase (ATP)